MKCSYKAFVSLAVLGQTLGVLSADAVECYAIDAANEIRLTFNSINLCANHCEEEEFSVFAAQADRCSCLEGLPSDDKKRDASDCNVACPGYALQNCGGIGGNYSVGTIEGSGLGTPSVSPSSLSTTATATTTIVSDGTTSAASSQTTSGTAIPSSSSTPLNNTVTATPSSTSGSSSPASSTVESTSEGAPIFGKGVTAVASVVSAVAAFFALI